MKDFIHTGLWLPTLTTTIDPRLRVVEIDNGYSWYIGFYVGNEKIDHLDMEKLRGTIINKDVLKLPVYSIEGKCLGSVALLVASALDDCDWSSNEWSMCNA